MQDETTHLNHVHTLGTPPPSTNTKYEYRITSVTPHATSIELYAGLPPVVVGKLYPIPQTSRRRLATCIAVVKKGARTRPMRLLASFYLPRNIIPASLLQDGS